MERNHFKYLNYSCGSNMHASLQREIPTFLFDSICYCDNLTYNRHEKSCFLLTKKLNLYEFRRKQLLNSIDLNESCFASLKQRVQFNDGKKCRWFGDFDANKTVQLDSLDSPEPYNIKFEKYIYINFDVSIVYLMIFCWDKVVVLHCLNNTTTTNGLQIVAEYENVDNVKIIPSTTIKFQDVVKIQFLNGSSICTNFQEKNNNNKGSYKREDILKQKREFKQLLEKVRNVKAELQFHKEITHKHFQSLRNNHTFGNNFLRSLRLEEKPILSRCGDLWIRITSADGLVIGLPLVNNSAPPNLTILKNLNPVLSLSTPISRDSNVLNYEYRLYQLHQTFDKLETFFHSEDIEFNENSWVQTNDQILPTSFAVLVIKFRLSQLVMIDGKCELFIRFQIDKELQMNDPIQSHTFEQHLFIKSLDFHEILQQRHNYKINFNEKTLHQDFLALSIISHETQLQIDFAAFEDENKFEELLLKKFDFDVVYRVDPKCEEIEYMEVDENFTVHKSFPGTLFYNRKPNCLWFGSLIKRYSINETPNDCDNCQTTWIFYNKNEDKAFLMFKLIFSELITQKCNVLHIKYGRSISSKNSKIIDFENSLRKELAEYSAVLNNKYEERTLNEKLKCLLQLQFNTDILSATLNT